MIISSDDDDYDRVTKKKTKQKTKTKTLERKKKKVEESAIIRMDRVERESESAAADTIGPNSMAFMAASALGVLGKEWIDEVETFRAKSSNIKGSVSGSIRVRLSKLKDVVTILVGKAEAVGDPDYLRNKITELTKQLRELQTDNHKIKQALEDSKKRIQELEAGRDCRSCGPRKGGQLSGFGEWGS